MEFTTGGMAGSNASGSSGRRDDGFQGVGIQQMAFWLKLSADSAPQGKRVTSGSTVYSAPSFSQLALD